MTLQRMDNVLIVVEDEVVTRLQTKHDAAVTPAASATRRKAANTT
jgi:hypothetical protein